jgi:hypothetical protein
MNKSKWWFKLGQRHATDPSYYTSHMAASLSEEDPNKQSFLNGVSIGKKRDKK